jgi:adenylate cyclase
MSTPIFLGGLSQGQRTWITRLALALGIALLIILFTQEPILRLGILQRLELATIDFRFQSRGVAPIITDSAHVVIVEITEESFSSLPGRFPFPRSYYAHLLRNLKAAGARAVAIDLLFSGPDSHDPRNDDTLRAALLETGIGVLAGKREADKEAYVTTSAFETFGNIFFSSDRSMGLVNIRNDADGVYRSYNTMFVMDSAGGVEQAVPTLAFAVLNKYFGFPPMTVPVAEQRHFLYAGRNIPRYDPGSLLINFYGPDGTFPHIRFHDVIDDSTVTTADEVESGQQINTFTDPVFGYLHDGTFKDKIVLVGVTVPEYKDLFPVSIARGQRKRDNLMYGVEIHANVIENILRDDFLRVETPWAGAATTLFLVLLTFFVTSQLREIKTRHYLVVGLLGFLFALSIIMIIGGISVFLFTRFHYVIGVVNAVLAVLGGYTMSTTYHLVTERKERMLIKSMFSTYVNPSLVDELVAHPEKLVLGGQREELTVLFSDIVGFTAISENLPPEDMVAILNEYLNVMSNIIFQNDGTLDKYEGDAVMAFWGAPIPQRDHALRACRSALAMQEALVGMNQTWKEQHRPAIRIRIGINTGEMVVGNMGAVGKFAYTVIGDSVNLASRLEGANREYHTGIMVSERTYTLVRDEILGRELDRIGVMGRSEPVTTYELLGPAGPDIPADLREFLAHYEEGKRLYYGRDWQGARTAFEAALRLRPDDYPTLLHLQRAEAYMQTPPPDNWNGVFVMQSK